jgi:hypothetical protein
MRVSWQPHFSLKSMHLVPVEVKEPIIADSDQMSRLGALLWA